MQEYIINGLLIVVALLAVILQIIGTRSSAGMTKKQKVMLWRILTATVLLLILQVLGAGAFEVFGAAGRWIRLAVFLVDYLVIGYDILKKAGKGIRNGQVFDEHFLMAVATLGALALAVYENGDYLEAIAVMLFYQVGEWFQRYAVGRSRRSIAALMDIRPDHANLVGPDGTARQVDPDEVQVGDVILVKPGERVPLDGTVLEGNSMMDTAALTGESVPRRTAEGDTVISGCINGSGLLRVRVEKPYGESTVAKILDLVENAGEKKAKAENFITKFARWYTPAVVIAALALAVLPPMVLGGGWADWVRRALIFLVISCPCALVISVPLSFFGGIGGASKRGILVKGGAYMEVLANARTVVFDKTGTLTKGVFSVTAVHPHEIDKTHLVELAALAESYSTHPIAVSLRAAYGKTPDAARVAGYEELSGRGVRARVDGHTVCVGNGRLMDEAGAQWHECHLTGTVAHVAVDGSYAGHIVISDEVKPDAAAAIAALKEAGVKKTVMLTGDAREVGEAVAKQLGIDEAYTQLLPADKVEHMERLLARQPKGEALAFVGDGVNDAPVLARADVGIAMGGIGSDAAIEAADVVLMDDKPSKLAEAVRISRRTLRIVHQNIAFALVVKALVLALGALGMATMWEAVFADVGVMVLAILNAMRALKAPQEP